MSKIPLACAAALVASLVATDAVAGGSTNRRYVPGGTRTVIVPPALIAPPPYVPGYRVYTPSPRAAAVRVRPSGRRY